MARYKHYLEDVTVVEAAMERMRHIYDLFDSVVVQFSGGKDSLVVMHLARTVAEELGRLPVDVIFRDEELIPDSVVDFVDEYRRKPWVRMRWYCVPLESSAFVLGSSHRMIQWDPEREHFRPTPHWAITPDPGDNRVREQTEMDGFMARGFPGKVAFITGIRASESLVRYRSVVNKLNENYITASSDRRVKLAKPIYDWEERDVFKWLGEHGIRWCSVYEMQLWAGSELRVSTPLHSENAKRLHYWVAQDPGFYERLVELFPDTALQARYWKEWDRGLKELKKELIPEGWDGCYRYIREYVTDPAERKKALRMAAQHKTLARKSDSYTPRGLLNALMAGTYKRTLLPDAGGSGRG